jgi:hypothetical protein
MAAIEIFGTTLLFWAKVNSRVSLPRWVWPAKHAGGCRSLHFQLGLDWFRAEEMVGHRHAAAAPDEALRAQDPGQEQKDVQRPTVTRLLLLIRVAPRCLCLTADQALNDYLDL